MGSHKNDRKLAALVGEFSLQFEPGHPAQLHVQKDAIRLGFGSAFQKSLSREKALAFYAGSSKQTLHRAAQAGVVVNDCYLDRPVIAHDCGSVSSPIQA